MEYDHAKFSESCEVLELNCPFSEAELRRQYRMLALKYHPDKFPKIRMVRCLNLFTLYIYLNQHLNKAEISSKPESYDDLLKEF